MKIHILIITILITLSQSYLEFDMVRFPSTKKLDPQDKIVCLNAQFDKKAEEERKKNSKGKQQEQSVQYEDDEVDENQNYKEICYEKDISYNIPLYYQNEIKYVSMDLTAPISWFKGSNCHLQASSKKCTSLQSNFKEALQGFSHTVSKHFKKKTKRKSKTKLAMIEGSSQLVKGIQQTSKNLKFFTQDSSRFTKLTELLMLGFWMRGEKDMLQIERTTFINATQISKGVDSLCDGAISLRFDETSQNSFLKEIIDYVKTTQKVITIYLGNNQQKITMGQLTTKNSQLGYGGLNWIKVQDDENYGKLPTITNMIFENEDKDDDRDEVDDLQYPAVFTLSASYIGLPNKLLANFEKLFQSDRKCQMTKLNGFFKCNNMKSSDLDKILTFQFNGAKISLPLQDLVLEKHHKEVTFNLKTTFQDYAIFGEPFFQKYYTVFDYGRNRIGIGAPRTSQRKQIINIVSLVRFVSIVFLLGCSFILCYSPVLKFIKFIKKAKKKSFSNRGQKSLQTRRLKLSSINQDDNYDELNDKVREAIEEDNEDQ